MSRTWRRIAGQKQRHANAVPYKRNNRTTEREIEIEIEINREPRRF